MENDWKIFMSLVSNQFPHLPPGKGSSKAIKIKYSFVSKEFSMLECCLDYWAGGLNWIFFVAAGMPLTGNMVVSFENHTAISPLDQAAGLCVIGVNARMMNCILWFVFILFYSFFLLVWSLRSIYYYKEFWKRVSFYAKRILNRLTKYSVLCALFLWAEFLLVAIGINHGNS